MNDPSSSVASSPIPGKKGFSGSQVALIVLVVILLTAGATFLLVRAYIFPSELEPVQLSQSEAQQLDEKLERIGWNPELGEPEPYTEEGADREVIFSEREVNALIGGDPELARRVAIDLSDDLASAKVLVTVPPDFPVMPGKLVRINAGFEMRLDETRKPVVILKGVSVMGVPLPNAWLGNLKNIDFVQEVGEPGFWNSFAAGVDDLRIRDGEIYIRLRE